MQILLLQEVLGSFREQRTPVTRIKIYFNCDGGESDINTEWRERKTSIIF